MSETKSNRPGRYQTSATGIAERLRWIASEIEQLGDQQIPKVWIAVDFQVTGDGPEQWPQRKHLIETLAAAFGVTPEYSDSGLYTAEIEHGLTVYGSYPPPQERRAKLLAELAAVDAEIEREQAEAAQVAVVHEEVSAWKGADPGTCGVECEATPLESAAQQLRTSQTGDEFLPAFGLFMDSLRDAAEAEELGGAA